jgi:hypothetical protein
MRFQHHIVDYVVLNGKMIMNSGQKWKLSCHISRYSPKIFLEERRRTTKHMQ